MAEKLLEYYKYMAQWNGLEGKVQLAVLTKIPSPRAAIEPDEPETIRLFQDAIVAITGKPAPQFEE